MPPLPPQEDTELARYAFLVSMQHELRTPATAIVGYAQMLLSERGLENEMAEDLGHVLNCGRQVVSLIDALLHHEVDFGPEGEGGAAAYARTVRHDLSSPLHGLMGFTESLIETLPPGDNRHFADLNRILRAGRRLRSAVDEVTRVLAGESVELSTEDPLMLDAVTTLEVLGGEQPVALKDAHVLVVDDDDGMRELISRRVSALGLQTSTARNGREAISMLRAAPHDAVLLDILMPELNGYQVLATLKADENLRHIPVIMVSAFDDMRSIARCIEMGADEYLPKNFDPILLRARLAAALEKKRLRERERIYIDQIRAEREKSDRLLLNILPESIASELKQGKRTIARRHEEVTVLFSDIVAFTDFAAGQSPDIVVERLNEIVESFDGVVERRGLEKIKTIGDAYMLCAGAPESRVDHATAVADAALEMRALARTIGARHGDPLGLRIGIHSGPVMAGVIGRSKFVYDLWGDTVNFASRMESSGLAGEIQVSWETASRLRGDFVLAPRGPVDIKGKGVVETWLLEGRAGITGAGIQKASR